MVCKVFVNVESGNCKRLDLCALLRQIGCERAQIQHIDSNTSWQCDDADTVVVCGGDGTLKNAIAKCKNKRLIFVPCGTLNESKLVGDTMDSVGEIGDQPFGYVCATGTFTQIGYLAQNRHKQRFKALAYLPLVLKTYKCHQIDADITLDGKVIHGQYTLLMAIKSKRCFGFDFNRCYDKRKGLYLLGIKSVGKDTFFNKIRLFWRFFRVFVLGIDKPIQKDQFFLLPFEKATITLDEPQDFCLDGEKRTLGKSLQLKTQRVNPPIEIVKTPLLRKGRVNTIVARLASNSQRT